MKLYFDRNPADNFEDLVDQFPASTFASPRRSTIPLLDYWRVASDHLAELGRAAQVPIVSPVELHFEYTVPVRRGTGNPSCTDLLIISSSGIIAVEAKYTEGRYQSVSEWLGVEPSENRLAVLGGWLEIISGYTGCALNPQAVSALPYQLVHRAASACFDSGAQALLCYLIFGDEVDYYAEKLHALSSLLGDGSRLKVALLQCPVWKLENQLGLERMWLAGDPDTSAMVRNAVKTGPLFQFGRLRFAN